MSLANALRKKWSGDVDIESIINEEVLKRRQQFDFVRLKTSIAELHAYVKSVDAETFDFDQYNQRYFQVFFETYADLPRKKGVFHPSGLDTACERALYYEFTNVTPTESRRRNISAQTQRTFDVGTWWHTYIQAILWRAGILEKSEVIVEDLKKRISGRGDGVLRLIAKRALMEVKTMNTYGFGTGKFGPKREHEKQAGVYATELGLDTIVFIYINKDSSEIKVHVRPVNKRLQEESYEKMDFVLKAVELEEVPKRICKTIEDKPACDCPFKSHCFRKRGT